MNKQPVNPPPKNIEIAQRHRWGSPVLGKWIARIASLLLAMVVWIAVISEESIERTLTIPIVPYADRDNLVWTGEDPGDAVVRLQGKARSLWWLEYVATPELRVPLSTLPSSGEVRLRNDMVELPQFPDVKILAILKPEVLPVKVERFANRVVPIKPDLTLITEEGFVVSGPPVSFPSAVEISGDRSRLHAIDTITTEPMTIKSVATAGSVTLKLFNPNGIKLGLHSVVAKYTVERLVEEKMDNIPIIPPTGWNVEPPWVSIRVSGPGSVLLSLHKRVLKAHFIAPDSNKDIIPLLDLPSMVKVIAMNPPTVKACKQ